MLHRGVRLVPGAMLVLCSSFYDWSTFSRCSPGIPQVFLHVVSDHHPWPHAIFPQRPRRIQPLHLTFRNPRSRILGRRSTIGRNASLWSAQLGLCLREQRCCRGYKVLRPNGQGRSGTPKRAIYKPEEPLHRQCKHGKISISREVPPRRRHHLMTTTANQLRPEAGCGGSVANQRTRMPLAVEHLHQSMNIGDIIKAILTTYVSETAAL
ncbi:hypothetical protein F4802DRAFT_521358 [Xylaria palmicola]|nr:hypothetical protein F4802DRAFT_521358 [Xylaria palmicola]